MTDHDRLSEIFLQACELQEAERVDFLVRACGEDAALRAEVEAMLRVDARSEQGRRTSDLEGRVVAIGAEALARPRPAPEWIGPYRVLERLGEGGMGVVYRAEQLEPVRREVAVKLAQESLGSTGSLARFEVERQALAMMDHPGIARLFDAGMTDDGRPYFAMELVRGLPITRYCRAHGLDLRQRVQLFLEVCRAVRHAHRRGVIHRDLKPSNILVPEGRRSPTPKVIDFSIAKALSEPSLATEFRTRTGQVIGTLEYMSPEQAAGRIDAVDTRSDVYALGVVLYELIADRLPHDVRDLPLHEAVRRIVNHPAPSLRAAATSATGRVATDLETIVGTCLEKAPDRRYESAAEIAEDLERFLDSRPILARRPSATYQLRKLVGRHRVAFGVAALVFAFLTVFSVTVTVQLRDQRRERARAETQARKAERIKEFMLGAFRLAVDERGYDVSVRESLDLAVEKLNAGTDDEPEAAVAIRTAVAAGYAPFAANDRQQRLLREAIALGEPRLGPDHEEVVEARWALAATLYYATQLAEAEREALRVGEALEKRRPVDADALAKLRGLLGMIRLGMDDFEGAERMFRSQLEHWEREPRQTKEYRVSVSLARENLANVIHRQGRVDEAMEMMREVLAMRREGGVALGWGPNNLGILLNHRGRYAEAEPLFREGIAYVSEGGGPRHPMLAQWLRGLGESLRGQGRLAEAEAACREGLEIHLEATDGGDARHAGLVGDLAAVLAALERFDEALPLVERSLSILAGLHEGDAPDLLRARLLHAAVLDGLERFGEAATIRGEALAKTRATLGEEHPWVVEGLRRQATALRRQGRLEEALPLARQAAEKARAAFGAGRAEPGLALLELAEILDALGKVDDAAAAAREARATLSAAPGVDPALLDRAKRLARG